MNGDYLVLAGRIRSELEDIRRLVARSEKAWLAATKTNEDDYYVDAVALNLHGFYAGAERIFESIAQTMEHSVPDGANWHQELLRQMAMEIHGVRPPVITIGTRDMLGPYRGFRHVVRNVYTFNLDPEQIGVLVRRLPDVSATLFVELEEFTRLLNELGNESQS
jgi:hypothetical protein